MRIINNGNPLPGKLDMPQGSQEIIFMYWFNQVFHGTKSKSLVLLGKNRAHDHRYVLTIRAGLQFGQYLPPVHIWQIDIQEYGKRL